jgi:hypothetical protein
MKNEILNNRLIVKKNAPPKLSKGLLTASALEWWKKPRRYLNKLLELVCKKLNEGRLVVAYINESVVWMMRMMRW